MSRIPRPAVAAGIALTAYSVLIWFDLPRTAAMDYAPVANGGKGLDPAHWWDQIHGLRGWGGFFGSGGSGAYYLHTPAPEIYRWLPVLAVIGAIAALLVHTFRRPPASSWPALAALAVLGYLGQFSAIWLQSSDPAAEVPGRTFGPVYGGYVTGAERAAGRATFFAGYERAVRTDHGDALCQTHCGTHPPGAVLAYWLPIEALRALPDSTVDGVHDFLSDDLGGDLPETASAEAGVTAWLGGHLTLLGGALIVLPLFGLARRLAGDRLALPLAALGLAIPGMLHFAPVYDELWALLSATILYVALRGRSAPSASLRWGMVAGGLLALATYGSFALSVLGLPLLAMALAEGKDRVRWLTGVAAGAALPWLLAWAAGLDVPGVVEAARLNHDASTLASRPYWPWVLFNLTDFVQLMGLPLAALAIVLGLRRTCASLYGPLFLGLIALLTLSGTARGETGRLWLFTVPIALMAVYAAAGRGRIGPRGVAALLASQALVTLLLQSRWTYAG